MIAGISIFPALLIPPFKPARQFFSGRVQIIPPPPQPAHFNQNVHAHEFLNQFHQPLLGFLRRRPAHLE
jgi:hypothetical protein